VLYMRTLRGSQAASPVMQARRPIFDGPTTFDGDSPVDGGRTATDRAPWALRLRVFVTRAKLDRRIAAGGSCQSSAALALRARQLTAGRAREQIAASLYEMVDFVSRPKSRPAISAAVLAPAAVRTGRQAILGLAQQLEASTPVSPRGVALARELITDGRSPLFNPYCEGTVAEAVREVQDALEVQPASGLDAIAA
jgi:hypothetical protein